MRSPRQPWTCAALMLACAAAGAQGVRGPQPPLPTLVTAHQAHSLTPEEAARAYPVHLRAVVTYNDPYIDSRHTALFVHDSTGSIFVSLPPGSGLTLRAGDVLDVAGVTAAADYAPVVARAQVKVVGQSHLPESAIKATMTQLLNGSMDGQWVEVEGVVHAVHVTERNVTFDVATVGGPLAATTLRKAGTDYASFADCLIRIRGNEAPVFNRSQQMVGVHIFFPSLEQVKVLRTASPDPFAAPLVPISGLLNYSPGLDLARRVHVRGTVTLEWAGRTLCIQQNASGLCMGTDGSAHASPGDLVDVIGFPAISNYKATLEDPTFRIAGRNAVAPTAIPVTPAEAFQGDHDGELTRMEGELVEQDRATGDLTLMLRSGNLLFSAILPKDRAGSSSASWKVGSMLSLTGICSVLIDSKTTNLGEGGVRPGSVQVLLRSIEDVAVVKTPPWWTPEHALEVLAAVGSAALAALVWILVLRRRVERQTRALRSSEERLRHLSEHDPLTGLPNRILLNDRLTLAIERAEESGMNLGLLMVDVDRFKEVNDAFGHSFGDKVLCELAKRISHAVRLTDTVARIGGDEFIVLLPELHDPEEARSVAAKIVAAVSQPFSFEAARVPVTVSVGVSTYPDSGRDAENLLHSADTAMYGVKAHGRNGFRMYTLAAMLSERA
ncbi:MAG: GGDEF domain-containing protein [Terracidiphilus sp.]|nr:GGDEF domain-containing protein [Terracidiphilus sp.]